MYSRESLIIVLLVAMLASNASAQSAYVSCEENYIPPLINVDFPDYGQGLDSDVTIITYPFVPPASNPHQPNPIAGTHSVLVYDPDHDLNRAIFYFNVNQDGTIEGAPPTSTTRDAKGNITSYSTVVGTYFFPGDNFPFTASTLNYQFPPVTDHRQFWLDSLPFDNPPSDIVRYLTITSTFSYTEWARWVSWLEYAEGPYDPGSAPMTPSHEPIVFTLQAMPVPNCPECQGGGCATCGGSPHLATATLSRFDAGVVITDTPIGYTPGVGRPMDFTVNYRQRYNDPPTYEYSNLGPQWTAGWISYITGGPTNSQGQAVVTAFGGDQFTYDGYEQTVVSGNSAIVVAEGDFQSNQGFSHATLHYRQGPQRYELWQPDGSIQVFGQTIITPSGAQYFVTSITDPQGNVTTLTYNAAAAAKGLAQLTSVTDPTGGRLLFSYDNSDPLKITKVTRSSDGLAARFNYSNGQLSSITDPGGLTSSYHYTAGTNFIDSMTTPYGTTTFHSTDGNGFYEADMTNPLGQIERVEYQSDLDTSLYSPTDSTTPSAAGLSINNSNLNHNNTFYWTRRAISDAAADGIAIDSSGFYAMAQVTHWATSTAGVIAVALSTKMPLEGRIWYNYPGEGGNFLDPLQTGASTSASATARLLDDGTTQVSFINYNANGLAIQTVDQIGRTTDYNYDSNGIDLLSIARINGSGQDILKSMTYNVQHEPLTTTDASGQTTTLTYNGAGQVLTSTNPKGETTTSAYYSSGYLNTVTAPASGATTTYNYDGAGRLHAVTDSEGYTVTNSYDNLDRLTSSTYPDGTSDQIVYKNLDVWKTIDRQARTTWNQYDAIREIRQSTDPLGRTTKFTWCTCGGLSTLTDANSHITTWNLDLQGRVTGKVFADGSHLSYSYENHLNRLHSMTDVRGDGILYAYNPDNTLASTSYAPTTGVAATSNESFTYDPVYLRLTAMNDGTGTTSYSYNSITGSSTTGAGLLASVNVPIAGSSATVAYTYDELGRIVGRTIDGSNTVSTNFDALGRVTNITNPLGSFTYGYVDTTNRLSNLTYPSATGLTASYGYFNNLGDQRLQDITNSHSGTVLSKFDYTYNPAGTIATWKQQTDTNTPTQYTLNYDAADQLTSAVQTNTSTDAILSSNSYSYDPAGNRLTETMPSGTTAGQFNGLNQLVGLSTGTGTQNITGYTTGTATSVSVNGLSSTLSNGTNFVSNVPFIPGTNTVSIVAKPPHGAPTTQLYQIINAGAPSALPTYDAEGNSRTDENGNTYEWDALDRLTKITYSSGASTAFAYDGFNRRVQLVERDHTGTVVSTKNYLWIGNEMAEERDASNTVTKRFFTQGEQQTGTNYYYTSDHLGSVHELCDNAGTIITRLDYDPYGRSHTLSGTIMPTIQYAGYYQHQTSGLSLTKYRAYNSNVGRWLSRDPISEDGGINIYNYVDNNSINYTDPLGRACSDFTRVGGNQMQATQAGANADLAAEEQDAANGDDQGIEYSGLVCQCDNDKSKYGYTGPCKGFPMKGNGRTGSDPLKFAPCPQGWTAVGLHYAHISGRKVFQPDIDYVRNHHLPGGVATPTPNPNIPCFTPVYPYDKPTPTGGGNSKR